MVGVAVDVQGVSAAKPWYDKHELTYPQLVDPGNRLSELLGVKYVPYAIYVDQGGIYRGQLDLRSLEEQLKPLLAEPMQAPPGTDDVGPARIEPSAPDWDAIKRKADESPEDYRAQFDAGQTALQKPMPKAAIEYLRRAVALKPDAVEASMSLASSYLLLGEKETAVGVLRAGLEHDPDNWLIRKQIWAIEHPDRFYDGPVDFPWQKGQLKREGYWKE